MKLRSLFRRQPRPKIFISYRRDDGEAHTDILYERLVRHFGRKQVFVDVDNIPIGQDFVDVINAAVKSCDILLAVIGKQWLTINDGQRRRLDNPEDFVRLEIAAALRSGIPVSPILVQGASIPTAEELPDELKPLARRNAFRLSRTHRREDGERLIKEIERVFAATTRRSAAGTAAGTDRKVFARVALASVCAAILFFVLGQALSIRKTLNSGSQDVPSPTSNSTASMPDLTVTPKLESIANNSPSSQKAGSPTPTRDPTPQSTASPKSTRSDKTQRSPSRAVLDASPGPTQLGRSGDTVTLDIDPTTGLIAVESCPVIRRRTFVIGTEPTKYCGPEYHKKP